MRHLAQFALALGYCRGKTPVFLAPNVG